MRQLAKFEESKNELAELDVTVYAVSVDTEEQAQEVADKGLTFPVLYGATREHSDALDCPSNNIVQAPQTPCSHPT